MPSKNRMKNTSAVFWFGLLALAIASGRTYCSEQADEWPVEINGSYLKAGTCISAYKITVLDGQTLNIAQINRHLVSQAEPIAAKPKPRPRLGVRVQTEDTQRPSSVNEGPFVEANRFLLYVANQFTEPWNTPRNASESMQWVHELEAECILAVDKQNGMIAIESTANSPDTADMAQLRKNVGQYNEAGIDYRKPHTTTSVEMNRFKEVLLSLAPLKIPNCLEGLPGKTLRIRLSVKIVKASENVGYQPAPPPVADSQQSATAAVDTESSGGWVTYTPEPGRFTRPIAQEELLKHTDVADPIYQYAIAFRYLEGDSMAMDHVLAVHWFTKAAEQGYAPAQSQLGFMYSMNYGVRRDSKKALYWYGKAAEQNYIQAIFNIGTMYQNGEGMKRDLAEAARWVRKGAELGDADCQTNLAWRYATGEGVAKDSVEAFSWYMKAALQGDTSAQFNVGTKYEDGLGVPKDEVEALAWYNLSPTNGLPGQINHRERLEHRLGPEAGVEARKRAGKLREKIANRARP